MSVPESEVDIYLGATLERVQAALKAMTPLERRCVYLLLWRWGERVPPDSSPSGLERECRRVARTQLEAR